MAGIAHQISSSTTKKGRSGRKKGRARVALATRRASQR